LWMVNIFLQGSPEMFQTESSWEDWVVLWHITSLIICSVTACPAGKLHWWLGTKVEAVIDETLPENMSVISGIPVGYRWFWTHRCSWKKGVKSFQT
jgi:hypothetical protein